MHNTIAIICDCDKTLAPDTTSYLLQENGIDVKKFWEMINTDFVKKGWDPSQAYLNEILKLMKANKIKQNSPDKMKSFAKKIKPYRGVDTFITELQEWICKDSKFIISGINLESYIISAGIEDLVKGCSFANQFTDIFASNYEIESKTGKYESIKSVVTFTEKTKYLYAINKGISGKKLRRHPYLVNDAIDSDKRRIPFENMIYIGDGPSDVPSFSAVRKNGGHCIGIMDSKETKRSYELARGRRINYGLYSSNYNKGSDLRLMLESIIKEIGKRNTH